jgi:predicted PurR-regulated permease PerM
MYDISNAMPDDTVSHEAPELPTRLDLKTVFLGGLFIMALLVVFHAASEIIIPFMLALMLKFVFHPVIRRCESHKISKKVASLLIILLLLGALVGMVRAISEPAASWGAKFQDNYPELRQRVDFLRKPVAKTQKLLAQADTMTDAQPAKKMVVVVEGENVSDKIIDTAQNIVGGLFTTSIILLFMLSTGDTFLRRFVEILPRFKDKRQAIEISYEIERDISRYLLTITTMNACVGVAVAFTMLACGVENPFLWGALAFILNYIPFAGPFAGIVIFFVVGLIATDNPSLAFVPAISYLLFHVLESTFLTPMLLAKRFTLNPVLIICSLIFWYWMWGIAGAIIAMPMLAILKISCDRIERLAGFGHLLEA